MTTKNQKKTKTATSNTGRAVFNQLIEEHQLPRRWLWSSWRLFEGRGGVAHAPDRPKQALRLAQDWRGVEYAEQLGIAAMKQLKLRAPQRVIWRFFSPAQWSGQRGFRVIPADPLHWFVPSGISISPGSAKEMARKDGAWVHPHLAKIYESGYVVIGVIVDDGMNELLMGALVQ